MLQGSCLCGQIWYKYDDEKVLMKGICYCHACRKITGSTNSVNIMVPRSKLEILGSPTQYNTTGGSDAPVTSYFCATCGSTLWRESQYKELLGLAILMGGNLVGSKMDRMEIAKPEAEIWTSLKPHWLKSIEDTITRSES